LVNFFINEEKVERIHFPITEVGTTSTVTMIIENDLDEGVELIPFVSDKDVEIIEYPRRLKSQEQGTSVWKFSPTKDRLNSLNTECGFREIIG